jgi:hypothetical protein
MSWQSLKDFKETFPMQVAEYAVAQGIENEPVCADITINLSL